jgi:hypothetical protein
MKGTETFKKVIQNYLAERAVTDPLFAETLQKPNKSIDDCITYIFNTVHESGNNGFDDDEIFGMAVHYYDEDDIKVGEPVTNVRVVSNHHVELTEEEKEAARQEAKERAIKEAQQQLTKKKTPVTTKPKHDPDNYPNKQLSLF